MFYFYILSLLARLSINVQHLAHTLHITDELTNQKIMQEHYNFSDAEYDSLLDDGVTIADLFKSVKLFDPYKTMAPIAYVSLFLYVDEKGDFNKPPIFPHKKIAQALFDKLAIKEKCELAEYIEDLEQGEF